MMFHHFVVQRVCRFPEDAPKPKTQTGGNAMHEGKAGELLMPVDDDLIFFEMTISTQALVSLHMKNRVKIYLHNGQIH